MVLVTPAPGSAVADPSTVPTGGMAGAEAAEALLSSFACEEASSGDVGELCADSNSEELEMSLTPPPSKRQTKQSWLSSWEPAEI